MQFFNSNELIINNGHCLLNRIVIEEKYVLFKNKYKYRVYRYITHKCNCVNI